MKTARETQLTEMTHDELELTCGGFEELAAVDDGGEYVIEYDANGVPYKTLRVAMASSSYDPYWWWKSPYGA
jgi:hypothetical protein